MRRASTCLACVVLAASLACARPAAPAGGAATVPATSLEQAALDGPPGPSPLALQVLVPTDGAVIPWTFPALDLQWQDGFQANTFRVRLRTPAGATVLELLTGQRRVAVPPEGWQRLRAAVGEGGAFEVALTGAMVLPDGSVLRGPVTAVAQVRFSAAGEHPTGHVLYNWLVRAAGANPGPYLSATDRSGLSMEVAMDGTVRQAVTSPPGIRERWTAYVKATQAASAGQPNPAANDPYQSGLNPMEWLESEQTYDPPAGALASRSLDYSAVQRRPGHPAWREVPARLKRECIGCHTRSGDGAYSAMLVPDNVYPPKPFAYTQIVMVVARSADNALLREVPGGSAPRFHPQRPSLLAYASTSAETGNSQRSSIFGADLHVLDIATGDDRPLPGASDPERCETFPEWSPDGRHLVFSRSLPGQPCEGWRGNLELAVVPWNEGEGGVATLVAGVSASEGSNNQPRFSRDGRWIVFYRTRGGYLTRGSGDLWIVPAAGGEARRLPLSSDSSESWHAFSPDGNWLAFVTNRERANQLKGYVARFYADGTTAPPLPLPGMGARDVSAYALDWVP